MSADRTVRQQLAVASDTELEGQLRQLGHALSWPDADAVAPTVLQRLVGEQPRCAGAARWFTPRLPQARLRRAVVLAVAALVLIAAVAVGLGLGVPGITIHFGPLPTVSPTSSPSPSPAAGSASTPAASPTPSGSLGAGLLLGRTVTLAEARDAVDWPLLVPALPDLGPPAETWLDGSGHAAAVSFVWAGDPSRPAVPDSSIGLLLTQFRGQVIEEFLGKTLGPGTSLVSVAVDGAPGFWIEGVEHAVSYPVAGDGRQEDRIRLAGHVLLWTRDGVTLRLEIAGSQADALRIAASMH